MIDEITRADVQKVRQALNNFLVAKEKLDIAESCGIECADESARCQHGIGVCTKFLDLLGNKYPDRK